MHSLIFAQPYIYAFITIYYIHLLTPKINSILAPGFHSCKSQWAILMVRNLGDNENVWLYCTKVRWETDGPVTGVPAAGRMEEGNRCHDNMRTYVVVEGLGLTRVVTCVTALRSSAVEIPEYTASSHHIFSLNRLNNNLIKSLPI